MSIEHAQHHHLWPLISAPKIQHFLKQRTYLWRIFFNLYIFLTVALVSCFTFRFSLIFILRFLSELVDSSWILVLGKIFFYFKMALKLSFKFFKETVWYKISSCFTYNIIYNEDKYITAPCNRGSVSAVNKWLCPLFFYIPQTKFVNNFFYSDLCIWHFFCFFKSAIFQYMLFYMSLAMQSFWNIPCMLINIQQVQCMECVWILSFFVQKSLSL